MSAAHAIPRLPAASTAVEVADCIAREGVVIIEQLVPPATMDALCAELSGVDGTFHGATGSFAGAHTVRNAGKPLGESGTAQELAANSIVCDAISLRFSTNTKRMVLGTCSYISVEPPPPEVEPAPPQVLHRDECMWAVSEWPWMPSGPDRPELSISVMWAATDFTESNGATRVVPGSHRWPRKDRNFSFAEPDCQLATMKKGSVLLWSGGMVHGAGAHAPREKDISVRSGLLFIYNLGWLKSEHNFHYSIPRQVMESFAPKLKDLIGLTGENATKHPWYTGPVYTQPYLGGAEGSVSGEGVEQKLKSHKDAEESKENDSKRARTCVSNS